ncbi:MAG: BamA/TamA family outer membrane protein [Vampirovibrionales bacterium]
MHATDPTDGWLNTIIAHAAMGLGNSSYSSVSANLRRYLKIAESSSLNLNAQGGSLVVGDVPQFDMFRIGGTNSVQEVSKKVWFGCGRAIPDGFG